jgi:hypothetical protein
VVLVPAATEYGEQAEAAEQGRDAWFRDNGDHRDQTLATGYSTSVFHGFY